MFGTGPGGGGSSVCPGLPVTCALCLLRSCMFEPEGNACSLTDSTAEEHVLALVEHAADEARDRINRLLPGGKVASAGLGGDVPSRYIGHRRVVLAPVSASSPGWEGPPGAPRRQDPCRSSVWCGHLWKGLPFDGDIDQHWWRLGLPGFCAVAGTFSGCAHVSIHLCNAPGVP